MSLTHGKTNTIRTPSHIRAAHALKTSGISLVAVVALLDLARRAKIVAFLALDQGGGGLGAGASAGTGPGGDGGGEEGGEEDGVELHFG